MLNHSLELLSTLLLKDSRDPVQSILKVIFMELAASSTRCFTARLLFSEATTNLYHKRLKTMLLNFEKTYLLIFSLFCIALLRKNLRED